MRLSLTLLALIAITLVAAEPVKSPWLTGSQQMKALALWPDPVPVPGNLRFYHSTYYSQRVAITNGRETNDLYHWDTDDVFQNAPTIRNPNRELSDWKANGGLDGIRGWYSKVGIALPDGGKITIWSERVYIANGGYLPKVLWSYPTGTIFVDLLVRKETNKVFELRIRTKTKDGWRSKVPFADKKESPVGYQGAGKACIDCHGKAGISERYGITVRGSDTVFSASPLVEGTRMIEPVMIDWDHWPLQSQ